MARKKRKRPDHSIAVRSALIGGFVLAALFGGIVWIDEWVVALTPRFAGNIQVALMLLVTWLATGAVVRTVVSLDKATPWWAAWLAGATAVAIGATLFLAAILLFPSLEVQSRWQDTAAWVGAMWVFFLGLGLVFSLMAVINARIRNRTLGNMLEIGLLLVVIFLILKLA